MPWAFSFLAFQAVTVYSYRHLRKLNKDLKDLNGFVRFLPDRALIPLDNKNESFLTFILYCSRLFVPLAYAEGTFARQ